MNQLLKKFWKDDEGASIVVFTLTLPLIIGMLGVTVEASYWFKSKKDLQLMADLSAYSGALELDAYNDNPQSIVAAKIDALNNGYDYEIGSIVVNSPPLSGSIRTNSAVEVIIEQKGKQYFSNILGENRINYKVRSVAAVLGDESICILSLNESARRSFEVTGSSITDVNECSVGVNSNNSAAARIGGSATLAMECLQVVGDIDISNASTVTPICDEIQTGTKVLEDPYEDLQAPNLASYPSSCETPNRISANEWAMSPGRYCSDMSFNTLVRMQPGTYVIDNADLKVYGGTAHLIGDGVSIILMNGGTLTSLNGGAEIDLTAPTTGDYAGVVIYGDRDTQPSNVTIKWNGNSDSAIEGLIYLPNQDLEYGGNTTGGSECTIVVADEILLTGNAEFKTTTCKSAYNLDIPGNLRIAIVE